VATLAHALRRIKGDLGRHIPESLIRNLLADRRRPTRRRTLTPAVTTYLFLRQVLHGNMAVADLRRLSGLTFVPSAYCQARARLPVEFFRRLQRAVIGRLRVRAGGRRWRGHRTFLLDGSSFSMPDTAELQDCFGQPSGQAAGCGFPVARLMALFEASTGYLLSAVPAPLYTHDLARAAAVHPELRPGDLLVGDRAFGSFAHLALLARRGAHGLFRAHQRRLSAGRRSGPRDRRVVYRKPQMRPSWLTAADFAALPNELAVREVRFRVDVPGRRVRWVTLVTTLTDAGRYPAAALARLYERRWQIETDLRHLKQTLGLDVLRCKTVPGVMKELSVFVTVYNLVRRVTVEAAGRQRVPPRRVSFVDALRWLRQARPGEPLPRLVVNPERPDRVEPRVRKRRPKQFPVMKRPRQVLREEILRQNLAA
jgi:Transposase DDE domain